jgi:hypothetical protein
MVLLLQTAIFIEVNLKILLVMVIIWLRLFQAMIKIMIEISILPKNKFGIELRCPCLGANPGSFSIKQHVLDTYAG